MYKICNSKMECLVVLETIEEAREKITELQKQGQWSWDIFECSEMPTVWVETPEQKKAREERHEAYMQKHSQFVDVLEKRSNRDEKTDYNDRENSVRHFWGLE